MLSWLTFMLLIITGLMPKEFEKPRGTRMLLNSQVVAGYRFLTTDAVNLVLGKKLGSDLVERLKISLLAAEALVDDAEYKQLGDERVREWLNSLKDAVYIADDLLDDVITKAATQKQVRSFWPSFLNRDRDMVDKIEGVVTRIEFLEKQKDFLGLQKNTKDNNLSSSSWRASTSLVEGNIYGRKDDQQALIKMMNDNSESQLSVIPIVGMGGVGKTTLAKQVYNNKEGFDLEAWVCISETFDVVEITRKTIEEITKSTCTLGSLNLLQLELKKILSEKKFFVVLDDVWSDDDHIWKKFITPFHSGTKGSTILLTTRSKEVASVVQTCRSYFLNELSEDYCWLLFADNACFPESNGNSTLEEIGRKIVKKCKGLPLAVETLGRLLRGKDDAKEWNAVLTSDIWEFSMKNSKIIPALLLSYFQLPAYLKRCFIYCSLYPKNHNFYRDELILLWMAEDLLRPPKRGESLKEVGCACFEELVSRLFFKQGWFCYMMHDLLHDLAVFLAGDFYRRLEEHGKAKGVTALTRHLSYQSISENFDFISEVKSLRTFLQSSVLSTLMNKVDDVTICISISNLKYLRVLSYAWSPKLDVLPDSIGELIHLRYLNLVGTEVRTLPESLCNLYNLQTLILRRCTKLTMLPSGMHNLVNLQHLDLRETSLNEMPGGLSKLKHLQILGYFAVGKQEDNGIQEFGGLSNIPGSFGIKKLENIVDAKEAKNARMMNKIHINELWLEWSSGADVISNTHTERDILNSLQPHNGLKTLTIRGYRGTVFPDWLGHSSYNIMTEVSLTGCNNCCMLPSLGQLPSLKSLRIQSFGQLERVGMEFYKNEGDHHLLPIASFPSLETLLFDDMPCWEEWHSPDSETFPRLKKLQIRNCPMLNSHPFLRMISSSKVCKLSISEDRGRSSQEMFIHRETLFIMASESVVESLFNSMSINHLTCLQEIQISYCSSAVSFPGNYLPKSLPKLEIWGCRKLEFPQQQQKHDLVELQITYSCDSLTSFSLDAFPNLKKLYITCENLESISMSEPPNVSLTYLSVSFCNKLEALPSHMNTSLPNLHTLKIHGCPNIPRVPEGGLPPNLKSLIVGGCKQQLRDLLWMCKLDALTHLTIDGDFCESVKSYPEVGLLPHLPSLTTLQITWFCNMETFECNQLLHLTSLQQLQLSYCQKLENMAGETLPSSLLQLKIHDCPLLEEHCMNKHQHIWPKIAHIPTIIVDDQQIHFSPGSL